LLLTQDNMAWKYQIQKKDSVTTLCQQALDEKQSNCQRIRAMNCWIVNNNVTPIGIDINIRLGSESTPLVEGNPA